MLQEKAPICSLGFDGGLQVVPLLPRSLQKTAGWEGGEGAVLSTIARREALCDAPVFQSTLRRSFSMGTTYNSPPGMMQARVAL